MDDGYLHVSFYVSGELKDYAMKMSDVSGMRPYEVLRWFTFLGMLSFKEIRKKHRNNTQANQALVHFINEIKSEMMIS